MRTGTGHERVGCDLDDQRGAVLEGVSRYVLMLAEHYDEFVDGMVQPLGITRSHVPLLLLLSQETEVACQNEIARHLGVDKATVSRNAARLIELGYVAQHRSPLDARASHLTLTDRGRDLIAPLQAVDADWCTGIGMGIADAEKVRLVRCLALMEQRAEQLVSDVRTGNLRIGPIVRGRDRKAVLG